VSLEEKLEAAKQSIAASETAIADLQTKLMSQEAKLKHAFVEALSHTQSSAIKSEELDSFIKEWIKRPWAAIPVKAGEVKLIVPKCFKLNFGWFEREEGAYNVFLVNRYYDLIQPIPAQLRDALNFTRPFDGLTIENGQLTISRPDKDPIAKVQKQYSRYLGKAIDEKTIQVKKGQEFALIAAVIRDGILPFAPHPIAKADLQERHCNFKLRPYQARDFEKFLKYGAVGVFYPAGQGKTVFSLEAMSRLKGRKLVLVPTATLKEQWLDHLKENTKLDSTEYEVEVYHKSHIAKLMRENWVLVVYDEMHRLPANTYLELATLRTKYRLNLTQTPWREDGRIDLIWALSGYPLGVDWNYFIEHGLIVQPKITVYIERDMNGKRDRLDELLTDHRKTIIFCDSLELGDRLAKRFLIPFVSGTTPAAERLPIIKDSNQIIVSRVGDLGISIKNLERVIEFDFLFGSRTQELQRLGRLFHADYKGVHAILMTVEEYQAYRKRLFSIYEKGFKVEIERGEGVPLDLSEKIEKEPRPLRIRSATIERPLRQKKEIALSVHITEVGNDKPPVVDEREVVDKRLVLAILESSYVRSRGGIGLAELKRILDLNHLKYDWIKVQNIVSYAFYTRRISGRTLDKGDRVYFKEPTKETEKSDS
jgi:DNA excision repair protein ERCC-3